MPGAKEIDEKRPSLEDLAPFHPFTVLTTTAVSIQAHMLCKVIVLL